MNTQIEDRETMKESEMRQWFQDALAYLRWGTRKAEVTQGQLYATLVHDIAGIAKAERCFVPRVSGYADAEAKGTL